MNENIPLTTKALHVIKYTIGSRVTPLAYVWSLKQVFYGFFLAFTTLPGITNLILFRFDAGVGIKYYGITLMIAAITLVVSMYFRNGIMTRMSSFLMILIMIWSFAIYIMAGYPALAALIAFDVLGWGYIYLASSLGTLWDYSPTLMKDKKLLDIIRGS